MNSADLAWTQLSSPDVRNRSKGAWLLTLGWAAVHCPCVLSGPQAEGTAVTQRSSSVLLAEAQEDKPSQANTFQASACVVSANIPLTKAGHITEPKVKGQGSMSAHHETKANHVAKTDISGSTHILFQWWWRRKGGNMLENSRICPHPKYLLRSSVHWDSDEICSEPTWPGLSSSISRKPLAQSSFTYWISSGSFSYFMCVTPIPTRIPFLASPHNHLHRCV